MWTLALPAISPTLGVCVCVSMCVCACVSVCTCVGMHSCVCCKGKGVHSCLHLEICPCLWDCEWRGCVGIFSHFPPQI